MAAPDPGWLPRLSASSSSSGSSSSDSSSSSDGSVLDTVPKTKKQKSKDSCQKVKTKVTRTACGKQLSLIKDLTKASLKTCQPPRAGQSAKAETKGHPTYNNKDWTFDKMTISPPDLSALLSPMASPGVLLDWTAARFEPGQVLSPLTASPLHPREDTRSNFRYAEDLPAQLINVPYTNTASKSAEEGKKEIPQKDIVLKNAESWAKLVRQSVTTTAIKSSKESFKQFRKVAQKKEELEKALKKKQMEDNKEREAPEKSSLPGPCEADTNLQPIGEDPESPESVCRETLDATKDVELQKSPVETQTLTTQSAVDMRREMARRKEQERRRRESMSGIDMSLQRDIMTSFELALD